MSFTFKILHKNYRSKFENKRFNNEYNTDYRIPEYTPSREPISYQDLMENTHLNPDLTKKTKIKLP